MKKLLYLVIPVLFGCQGQGQKQQTMQKDYNLVIGTYTAPGKSEGIYTYNFNTETAELTQTSVEKNVINPSFLTVTDDKKFVYAVNENAKKSEVSAFSFDAATGKLGFLNKQKAEGEDPCYIIADDKNVLIANYSSGNISVYGRETNGALTAAKQVIQHTGSGINKARQESAHVHMVRFTPDGKYVVSNDLGEDKVYLYEYHKDDAKNILVLKDSIGVKAGSGPRHIVFSPGGKFAYLLQEMQADLTVFSYEGDSLKKIQETSLVAKDFKGESGASDIQFSADGKFLYASNRGSANTITTFAVAADGKLTEKGQISSGGKGPRAFVIDPSGKWLLAGNQNSDNIVIFERDASTGLLKDSGKKVSLGAPVCFVFVPKG